LEWKNKNLKLLNHGASTYEWVEPSDWRVSEVRLLEEVARFGEPSDNLLIEGDALYALTSLSAIPEYATKYKGKIKLCYIDPPFNTGQTFANYKDSLVNSIWLTMFRDRLMQIKELLAPDGSVWVHLDDEQTHRARVILDEVFGVDNFVATFVWEKLYARKSNGVVSTNHDHIHVYANTAAFSMNKQPGSPEQLLRYTNRDNDPRGRWQSVSFHVRTDNPERRLDYRYPIMLPSGRIVYPPAGRHWNGKVDRYERLLAENQLWFGAQGDALPRFKQFLKEEDLSLVPMTVWPRDEVGDNDESKKELGVLFPNSPDVFATPKPERLLQRVLTLGTKSGDLVLDCFGGSGTTAAVAHKMGRRWVTIELISKNIDHYIKPRIDQVIDGTDRGGISESTVLVATGELPDNVDAEAARKAASVLASLQDAGTFGDLSLPSTRGTVTPVRELMAILQQDPLALDSIIKELVKKIRAAGKTETATTVFWDKGGGYTHLRVGESLFEDIGGVVVLADWATGGPLAEAVAAQLRFPYLPEGPFAGSKGKQRLAVIDGMLTNSLVDYLLGCADERETLVVVAQSLAPNVGEYLRSQRKGSRARKVPRDLAHVSRQTEKVVLSHQTTEGASDV